MLRIGLTGGIGAGKSALSATFAQCGGIVVDGDVIAREVVQPGTEGLASLVEAFGDDILQPDGSLNFILSHLGLGTLTQPQGWLGNPATALPTLIVVMSWSAIPHSNRSARRAA